MYFKRSAVWLSASLFFLSIYITFFFMPAHLENLGFAPDEIGANLGLYGLAMLVTRILIAIVALFFMMERGFIQFGLVSILLGLLIVFAPTWGLFSVKTAFYSHRAFLGIGVAFYVFYTTLFKSLFSREDLSRAIGWIAAAYALPQIVASLAGGFSIARWGIAGPFSIGIAACVTAFLLISAVKVERTAYSRVSWGEFVASWDRKLIITSFTGMVIVFILQSTFFGFTLNWATRTLSATRQELAWITLAMQIPMASVMLLLGMKVVQEFLAPIGSRRTLMLGMGILGGGVIMIPTSPNLGMLIVWQAVGGIGFGLAFPTAMAESVRGVDGRMVPWAIAFFQCAYAIGFWQGPNIAAQLVGIWGLDSAIALMGLTAIASLTPIFFGLKEEIEVIAVPAGSR